MSTSTTDADSTSSTTVSGLTNRAFRGTGWTAISTVGKQVLTFASVATVARKLGPGAYGLMGMAVLVVAFIANFRDLGTASAIVQRQTISRRLLSSLFWVNAGVGALMFLLVAGTAPLVAKFFHEPQLLKIVPVFALSMLFAALGVVHNAILTRNMVFNAIAGIDLIVGTIKYLIALVCAYAGLGVWSLVYANVADPLLSTLAYWFFAKFRPALEFDVEEVKSVAKFSSNLTGFGIINYGYRNADNVIVGRFLGADPLAYYQMAYNMMLFPLQNISSAIAQVLFPAFSRIQNDDERFRSAFIRGSMLIALITFPVIATLGVVADPLTRAILGKKWIAAIPLFQILIPVGIVQSIPSGIIYTAKGRTDLMLRWGMLALVTLVIAFLIGVHFGTIGVAASYAIAYVGVLMIPGWVMPFNLIGLRLRTFFSALMPQFLVTAGMAALAMGWLRLLSVGGVENAWVRLLSTCVMATVIYIAAIFVFRLRVLDHLEEVLVASGNPRVMKVARILALRRSVA